MKNFDELHKMLSSPENQAARARLRARRLQALDKPSINVIKLFQPETVNTLAGELYPEKPWTLYNLNDRHTNMDRSRILVNESYPETLLFKGRNFEEEQRCFQEKLRKEASGEWDEKQALKALNLMASMIRLEQAREENKKNPYPRPK